jgi:tRNA(fMet)-specific endonuclease VapC
VSLRYLFDTNALSEPVKPRPHSGFLRRLRANQGRIAIASVTWHEALFGLYRLPAGERRRQVHEYLFEVIAPSLPTLSYDAIAADWHAAERARLGAKGRAVTFADGQIAAIARANGLAIVSANERDFAPFEGVAVENWLRAR